MRTTFPITMPPSTRGNPDVGAPEAHSRSRNRGVPEINEYSLFRNSNLTRDASSDDVDLECNVVRHFAHSLYLSLSLPLSLPLFSRIIKDYSSLKIFHPILLRYDPIFISKYLFICVYYIKISTYYVCILNSD